jgi:uncharacterized membrane protein
MEPVSWNLLFQIPLAGVVIFVVVLFLKHLKELTTAFMVALTDQAKAAADAVTKQVETTSAQEREQIAMFMNAIQIQREENIKAMNNVAAKMENLSNLIMNSLTEMKVVRSGKKPIVKER